MMQIEKEKHFVLSRFVFFLDGTGPDFNVTCEFYAKQLRKDLFVNIYKNGEWGTITRNIIDNSSFKVALDNNTAHINNIM